MTTSRRSHCPISTGDRRGSGLWATARAFVTSSRGGSRLRQPEKKICSLDQPELADAPVPIQPRLANGVRADRKGCLPPSSSLHTPPLGGSGMGGPRPQERRWSPEELLEGSCGGALNSDGPRGLLTWTRAARSPAPSCPCPGGDQHPPPPPGCQGKRVKRRQTGGNGEELMTDASLFLQPTTERTHFPRTRLARPPPSVTCQGEAIGNERRFELMGLRLMGHFQIFKRRRRSAGYFIK